MIISDVNWGPSGLAVYERTYQRVKPDGEREDWYDTTLRVVDGNMGLVYGPPSEWDVEQVNEAGELLEMMREFKVLPAGRHLWASGVKGRQYLFNCHVAGWGASFSTHAEFTFMRLMEGGGVGANYSSRFLHGYGLPQNTLRVHIVCDPGHADYDAMREAGILSERFTSDWDGAFEIEDSREGWAAALTDLIDTSFRLDVEHDDRVYDVTNVRPAGARLKTFGGTASGPAPLGRMLTEVARVLNGAIDRYWDFDRPVAETVAHVTPVEAMEIDHAIAECVVSGGVRRSARMAMVEWDDPFIYEFLSCKDDTSKHWTTNISVAIDDRFIEMVNNSHSLFPDSLLWDKARDVHTKVVSAMLKNGEPGYWNYSLSQNGEINEVICTNPCGEITLEAWENCNLGHVNLQAFVNPDGSVDAEGLHKAHRLMTRFLMRATFGDVNDPGQAAVLARNRRIGVGHFGVQGYLALLGIPWSEARASGFGFELRGMRDTVRDEARNYAFDLRIPEPVKVTTVAPTGSIAKLPGASEGIHPIYAREFIRRIRFSTVDERQAATIEQYRADGYDVALDIYDRSGNTSVVSIPTRDALVELVESRGIDPAVVESADEISLEAMMGFLAMYQTHYADNAVSFTANVPEGRYSVEYAALTVARWLPLVKGVTIMPDGTRPQAPYERLTREQFEGYENQAVDDGIDEECANGACPIR